MVDGTRWCDGMAWYGVQHPGRALLEQVQPTPCRRSARTIARCRAASLRFTCIRMRRVAHAGAARCGCKLWLCHASQVQVLSSLTARLQPPAAAACCARRTMFSVALSTQVGMVHHGNISVTDRCWYVLSTNIRIIIGPR